jgi:coatomer protein complex subunit gamma
MILSKKIKCYLLKYLQLDLPEGFELVKVLPCARLEYNVSGVVYVIVATPEDVTDWVATLSPTLKFVVKDCDPATGEPDSNEG